MIRDTSETKITSAAILLSPGDVYPFTSKIDCRTGFEIGVDNPNSDITIEARIAPAAYANIASAPIDVSAYAGQRKAVDFRVTCADPADAASFVAEIQVRPS